MLIRILFALIIIISPVGAEINEKFFEIKLKPCDQNYQESEFKDLHFYHPISFDINFNKKIYKKPINLIKACTISKKLKFIINK